MKTFSRLPLFPKCHGSTSQIVLIVLCVIALGVIGWMLSLPPELKGKYGAGVAAGGFSTIWLGLMVLVLAVLALFMPLFVWQCAREAQRSRELLEDIRALQREMLEQSRAAAAAPYAASEVQEEVPIYPTPRRERLIR